MAIYIDEPLWPAHGTRWSHLVSDDSLTELHRFAGSVGIPARAFDGDHYDVPAAKLADLVDAGAQRVDTRAMVRILSSSGLRAARPRSAKPKYRSRDKALAAAILTPPIRAARYSGAVGPDAGRPVEHAPQLAAGRDAVAEAGNGTLPVPRGLEGYDRFITAATLGDLIARLQRARPAIDAVVVVEPDEPAAGDGASGAAGSTDGAIDRLRAVYLDGAAIDGRSRYRHPAGAWVLGRVHWSAAAAGGWPGETKQ